MGEPSAPDQELAQGGTPAKPPAVAGAAAALARLRAPLAGQDGIGPALAARLDRLLARSRPERAPTRLDLLWHLPSGAVERTPLGALDPAAIGQMVTLELQVDRHLPPARPGRPHNVRCFHPSGFVHLVYFNLAPNAALRLLPEGARRRASGTLARFGNEWQIVHPEIEAAEGLAQAGARPVYPLTQGLPAWRLRRAIADALGALPELPEWQDPALLRREGWPSWQGALQALHQPESALAVEPGGPARRRLAYDELLASQLSLALLRRRDAGPRGRSLPGDGRLSGALRSSLPFALTPCQARATAEIAADMARPERMLRLLQGDVGSGKTVVALQAMLQAVESGTQAALMAPTELLARQHAATLAGLLAPLDLAPVLLTGRERGRARAEVLAALASGAAPIAVGTHALFQAGVAFHDLGLAVIDEQHRFGVQERLGLAAKGPLTDVLVMTATPIPRSLMLALYGDMDSSELRTRPPGRPAIETRVLPLGRIEEVLAAIGRALGAGERIFWICPAIDADPGTAAAEARFQALAERFGARVGLVHGRLAAPAREAAMQAFALGRTELLVATTVIEVGIDVPDATVVVVEQAERFGLAQLHQLRGRIGRGTRPSACLLLYDGPLGQTARARLRALRASSDGFHLAEEDLRLRGPGEVLGTRQSGLPDLRLADLAAHADLLAVARDDVRLVLTRDPELTAPRGRALRVLLRLFERDQAFAWLRAG